MARARIASATRLLHALLAQGETEPTYKNLATATDLSPRTIATLMAELRERKLVRTSPAALGDAWGLVLSVAIGTETCRAGLVDANGSTRAKFEAQPEPNQLKLPPDALLERVAKAVEEVLRIGHEDRSLAPAGRLPVLGLATAWACPVRGSKRPAGTIMHPAWAALGSPTLPEGVAAATGFPVQRVHAINDANAHLLAVAFDEGRRRGAEGDEQVSRIALLLRIGGGIGASTMILAPHRRARLSFVDSTMLGGARSLAGELAHLPIESSIVQHLNDRARWVDGLAPLSSAWPCSCGQSGHLEALAGGMGWMRRMEDSEIDVKSLVEGLDRYDAAEIDEKLANFEDLRVVHALEDVGRLIGRSLASPILLLDPHSLFLTGSFAVEPVVNGIIAEREAWRHVFGDALSVKAIRGRDSRFLGVRGGALAVFRSHVYRRFEDWLRDPAIADQLVFSP